LYPIWGLSPRVQRDLLARSRKVCPSPTQWAYSQCSADNLMIGLRFGGIYPRTVTRSASRAGGIGNLSWTCYSHRRRTRLRQNQEVSERRPFSTFLSPDPPMLGRLWRCSMRASTSAGGRGSWADLAVRGVPLCSPVPPVGEMVRTSRSRGPQPWSNSRVHAKHCQGRPSAATGVSAS
jgi:hypothetical protein